MITYIENKIIANTVIFNRIYFCSLKLSIHLGKRVHAVLLEMLVTHGSNCK